jgi:hypothetical protein
MRLLTSFAILACCCLLGTSQAEDGPKADRWRGLVLDESTAEDALKTLGKPSKDKTVTKQTVTRVITFKNLKGISEAQLVFEKDRLVAISLKPSPKIDAKAIPNIYGLEFEPRVSGFEEAINPGDYERHEGRIYPKTYPAVYQLICVTPRSRITCLIANNSFGSILKQSAGIRDETEFPGHAILIQLVSRTLDNRKGADALK